MDALPLHVDVRTVKDLLDDGEDFLLLDCREADEYALVHIAQARHVPMGEIANRVGEIEPQRQKRIVVHCHHGGRSLKVTQWLRQQGFVRAQNMSGGIDAWSLLVDTSLPRY